MIIFPAIDIRGGRCVRLTEGRFDKETVFADNPVDIVERWIKAGAEYLHVVDLDGALAGASRNLDAIENILAHANIPVQVGGGIRTLKNMEQLLSMGVARVILGSVAVKNPALVEEACAKFPGKIVVGIDAKDGEAAVEGWGVRGGMQALELAKKMSQVGVEHIVFTDIARDGNLSGVNVEATAQMAMASGVKIIASGGVSSLEDIAKLKKYEDLGIEGCIIGKAIYTGAVDLAEALAVAKEK